VPGFLSTDWILEQFGKSRLRAQQQYREFVRDGMASRPWDDLKGQIYLGGEAFIEKHAPKKALKEIPRAQLRAAKPSLEQIFGRKGGKAIGVAYEQGYRLNEIAAHLGVHYATVSRRLKRIEQAN
jgi:predicted transcriptional regulator